MPLLTLQRCISSWSAGHREQYGAHPQRTHEDLPRHWQRGQQRRPRRAAHPQDRNGAVISLRHLCQDARSKDRFRRDSHAYRQHRVWFCMFSFNYIHPSFTSALIIKRKKYINLYTYMFPVFLVHLSMFVTPDVQDIPTFFHPWTWMTTPRSCSPTSRLSASRRRRALILLPPFGSARTPALRSVIP